MPRFESTPDHSSPSIRYVARHIAGRRQPESEFWNDRSPGCLTRGGVPSAFPVVPTRTLRPPSAPPATDARDLNEPFCSCDRTLDELRNSHLQAFCERNGGPRSDHQRVFHVRSDNATSVLQAKSKAGATGLEPATSGVTGRFGRNDAQRRTPRNRSLCRRFLTEARRASHR
jgi:hypothetical protein